MAHRGPAYTKVPNSRALPFKGRRDAHFRLEFALGVQKQG